MPRSGPHVLACSAQTCLTWSSDSSYDSSLLLSTGHLERWVVRMIFRILPQTWGRNASFSPAPLVRESGMLAEKFKTL